MTYNLTDLQNAERIEGLFSFANAASGGILSVGIMIAIFFVLLLLFRRYDFTQGMAVSGFTCFILSGLLAYGGYINVMVVFLFLIITAFSTFYLYLRDH